MISKSKYFSEEEISERMNLLGSSRTPFLFVINFDMNEAIITPLEEIDRSEILYSFEEINNDLKIQEKSFSSKKEMSNLFEKFPVSEEEYKSAFDKIQEHISYGDSYLLNLTFRTKIETHLDLIDFYAIAKSKFKLYVKNKFVCFSPEPFVKIDNGIISSYPMKGTISAEIPNSEQILMADEKEIAEHYTIVDLLRNDLSMVAKRVRVEDFRYIEKISTDRGDILQTSSRISGKICDEWEDKIGTIITTLLPAGSVTGAPKKKTVEIIRETEDYERGFYTGVAGIYDGVKLTSCVLIRFIGQSEDGLYFKTGGGITSKSDCRKEYLEMLEKIYVPTF